MTAAVTVPLTGAPASWAAYPLIAQRPASISDPVGVACKVQLETLRAPLAEDRLLVARKSGLSSASIQYQLNLDRSIKQRHETMADVSQPRSSRCRSLRFAAASWRVGFLDSSTADASVGTFVRGGLPRRPNSFQERALRTRMSRNGELVSEEGGDGFESDIPKPENVAFTMGCAHA